MHTNKQVKYSYSYMHILKLSRITDIKKEHKIKCVFLFIVCYLIGGKAHGVHVICL